MVNHSNMKVGDWVQVDVDGTRQTRKITQVSVERIGTKDGEQEGWFLPEEVYPIELTGEWLTFLGFEREKKVSNPKEAESYRLGTRTFTFTYPNKNNKKHIVLDCHGAHPREFIEGLTVHELQNHFHGMTKMLLG